MMGADDLQHDSVASDAAERSGDSELTEGGPVARGATARTLLAAGAFLLPILLAVAAVVLLAGGDDRGGGRSGPAGGGRTVEYTIPAGTAALMAKGYPVPDVLPEQVDLLVGDTVVVENLDDAVHTFGPITVRPGETTRLTFDRPGYYFGICTVGTHDTVTFVVT